MPRSGRGMTAIMSSLHGLTVQSLGGGVWNDATVEPWHDEMGDTVASGFCYVMTNRPRGVLYVGVTSNLLRRVHEHRNGLVDGFTKQYGLGMLVHYEEYPLIVDAIRREKAIKHWRRDWKIALVEKENPDWVDLHEHLL